MSRALRHDERGEGEQRQDMNDERRREEEFNNDVDFTDAAIATATTIL